MEEEESVEFKTVKACAVALAKALKGAGLEIGMVNFLKEEGFINEGVRLSVIDIKTSLNVLDKTNLLVEGIKDRIDQDEDSFWVLVDKFKLSGVMYKPIVKKLTSEHIRQSLADMQVESREYAYMCNVDVLATCNVLTASGTGSNGVSSTGNHLDLHFITAASQSKISTDTNIVFKIMT